MQYFVYMHYFVHYNTVVYLLQVFLIQWTNRLQGGESSEVYILLAGLREYLPSSRLGATAGDPKAAGDSAAARRVLRFLLSSAAGDPSG